MAELNNPIYRAQTMLTDMIPLNVYLVKGTKYAVWIDSGVKAMFPRLMQTMEQADVKPDDLRFILHTHSHHDHIGCNAQLQDATGCLIAAPAPYAVWHTDFERHYQEFARPFPDLVPDTPELRREVLDFLDEPRPLDLYLDEGSQFNLGGEVSLRAYSLPGHLLAELGWFEVFTQTLILGDAITGVDWPFFHSHLSVQGYRDTLKRIKHLLIELDIKRVYMAHFPTMTSAEVQALITQAERYIDDIEVTLIRILAAHDRVTLKQLWVETCLHMERLQEFRSLNMVHAHVQDLLVRGLIHEVEPHIYKLR